MHTEADSWGCLPSRELSWELEMLGKWHPFGWCCRVCKNRKDGLWVTSARRAKWLKSWRVIFSIGTVERKIKFPPASLYHHSGGAAGCWFSATLKWCDFWDQWCTHSPTVLDCHWGRTTMRSSVDCSSVFMFVIADIILFGKRHHLDGRRDKMVKVRIII